MRSSSFFPFSCFFSQLSPFFSFIQGMRFAVRAARHPVYFGLHADLYVAAWYLQINCQGCRASETPGPRFAARQLNCHIGAHGYQRLVSNSSITRYQSRQ